MLMAMNSLVEVERLSKLYARSTAAGRRRAAGTLAKVLLGRRNTVIDSLQPSEFWALKDINFRVERGEALGIIGLNGSGKTTLLRILAGQILPDEGEVRLGGTTAALIDSTAGFRMNASGRENIYLKGAMLGRSRNEMEAAFDDIVAFTELGQAIEAPISSYSSGMLMRLAFAINTASTPDILIIDETLSVGDFRFRQKCLARLRELREHCCFILVSHSMGDINRFCTRAIVLHKGSIVFEDDPVPATEYYLEQIEEPQVPMTENNLQRTIGPTIYNREVISDVEHYWSNKDGKKLEYVCANEDIFLRCRFRLNRSIRYLTLGVPIYSTDGLYLAGCASAAAKELILPARVGTNEYQLKILKNQINPGTCLSNFIVRDGAEYIYRKANMPLQIISNSGHNYYGAMVLQHQWQPLIVEAQGLNTIKHLDTEE